METYVGLNEDALRNLLSNCTDFSERRRIRAAIRGLVQHGSSDTTAFDYQNNNAYRYSSKTDNDSHRILEAKIKNATDEDELNSLLSLATDYQDRRKIRTAIREMRRQKQEEEERFNNNNNSIRTSSRQYPTMEKQSESKKLNLEGITDESVLQKMLDETEEYDERRQIRAAMRELWKQKQDTRNGCEDEDTEIKNQDSNGSDEFDEPEKDNLETRLKRESETLKYKPKIEEKEPEEEVEGGREVNFALIQDPKILENLLESSRDFGERSQIRALLKELLEKEEEIAAPPYEMIKKRRLSEGLTDVIWLDDIDRIHPEKGDREVLEHVEEEDAEDFVSYDEIKDVEELEKLLKNATDIGEKRMIRGAIANLKKAKEEKAGPPKSSSSQSEAGKKDAKVTDEVKASETVTASKKNEAVKKTAAETTKEKAPSTSQEPAKTAKKDDDKTKVAPKPEPKDVKVEPSKQQNESKSSSLASKSSKPAEKPESKPSPPASKPAPKPQSKTSKPEHPVPKPESKSSSLASKFSKPEESSPKPVEKKGVGSIAGNKFAKVADSPPDPKSTTVDKKKPETKPLVQDKKSVDKTVAIKDEKMGDGSMTEITEDKIEIPGGEITSKKSVSVSKTPDGSVTTTTTVSTSAVKTEHIDKDGGVGGKTSTMVTKKVVSKTMTSSSSSTVEEISSDGSTKQETKKNGKISDEFWKKAEANKKKPSPLGKSNFGIGNLKNRFQNDAGSPGKFGKGSLTSGKVGKFSQKFENISSSSKPALPSKDSVSSKPAAKTFSPMHKPKTMSADETSTCLVNGQCGTPNASPVHKPKTMSADKISTCPGNGQCGTPISSPTHAPKKTLDDVKPSVCPGEGQCGTPVTSPPSSPTKQISNVLQDTKVSVKDEKPVRVSCNGEQCLPPVTTKCAPIKSTIMPVEHASKFSLFKSRFAPIESRVAPVKSKTAPVESQFAPIRDSFKNGDEELDMCNGQSCPPVPFNIISPDMTNKRFAEDINADMDEDVKVEVELIKVGRSERSRSRSPSPGRQVIVGGAISMLGEKYAETRKKTSPRGSPRSISPASDDKPEDPEDKDSEKTKYINKEAIESSDSGDKMAPVVVDNIEDENVLEKMLEDETDFEERKKIRGRLRDIRKKKRDDREKRVNQMENDMFKNKQDSIQQSRKNVMDSFDPTKTDSLRLTRDSKTTKLDKPEDNNNTIIKAPTNNNTVTTVKDDGKTTTTTTKSVKEGGGTKTVTKTSVSKTDDKDTGTKSTSSKTETVSKTQAMVGGGAISSSRKTVTESSSSSSTSTSTGGTKPRSTDTAASSKNVSKFDQQLEDKKKEREAKREEEQKAWKAQMAKKKREEMEKRKKDQAAQAQKKASIMNKFGGPSTGCGGIPARPGGGAMARAGGGGGGGGAMVMNASTIKQKLLEWAQQVTRGYAHVNITNFSSSWCDGMAFCAVVHKFFPEAFEFDKLNPKQRRKNFDLAFNSAEKYGDIMPLLETDDMLMMKNKPDWKCVFTYVQSLYRHLNKLQEQQAQS